MNQYIYILLVKSEYGGSQKVEAFLSADQLKAHLKEETLEGEADCHDSWNDYLNARGSSELKSFWEGWDLCETTFDVYPFKIDIRVREAKR